MTLDYHGIRDNYSSNAFFIPIERTFTIEAVLSQLTIRRHR